MPQSARNTSLVIPLRVTTLRTSWTTTPSMSSAVDTQLASTCGVGPGGGVCGEGWLHAANLTHGTGSVAVRSRSSGRRSAGSTGLAPRRHASGVSKDPQEYERLLAGARSEARRRGEAKRVAYVAAPAGVIVGVVIGALVGGAVGGAVAALAGALSAVRVPTATSSTGCASASSGSG